MTLVGFVILVLAIANVIWAIQTRAHGGWPLWVNLIGSVFLALATFTSIF